MKAAARTSIHHGGRDETAPSAVEPIVGNVICQSVNESSEDETSRKNLYPRTPQQGWNSISLPRLLKFDIAWRVTIEMTTGAVVTMRTRSRSVGALVQPVRETTIRKTIFEIAAMTREGSSATATRGIETRASIRRTCSYGTSTCHVVSTLLR